MTIELRQVPSRPTLLRHACCPLSGIADTIGPLFGEVAQWAGAHGLAIAGPAIARYVSVKDGQCEFDAGFVLESPPPAVDQDVKVVDVGQCSAAYVVHHGAYEQLHETYAAIEAWMKENGYETAAPMWEEYFSPPGTPPEQMRTDVYWPVKPR